MKIAGIVLLWFLLDLGLSLAYLRWGGGVSSTIAALFFVTLQLVLFEGLMIRVLRPLVLERDPELDSRRVRANIGLGTVLPFGWIPLVIGLFLSPHWMRGMRIALVAGLPMMFFLITESIPFDRWSLNPISVSFIQGREAATQINQWSETLKADPHSYLTVDQRAVFYEKLFVPSVILFSMIRQIEEEFILGLPELSREEAGLQLAEISLRVWELYLRDSRIVPYKNPLVLTGLGGVLLAAQLGANAVIESSMQNRLKTVLRDQIHQLEQSTLMGPSSRLENLKVRFVKVFGGPV